MSWDGYIDNLMACGHFEAVAILGVDGSVWATSKDFKIERAEAAGIAGGFKNTGGIANSGITVAGTKYFFLQGDDKQIQCKKGLNGLSLGKSCQCIIVGVYNDKHQPGSARVAVEKMCDHLRESNY